MKAAIFRAYKLVPEVYTQCFRSWKKGDKQSYLEFARDTNTHLTRWCSASDVNDFESLCEVIVLEQFRNSLPVCVATYVSEQKAQTAAEAAALVDNYMLTHRGSCSEPKGWQTVTGTMPFVLGNCMADLFSQRVRGTVARMVRNVFVITVISRVIGRRTVAC